MIQPSVRAGVPIGLDERQSARLRTALIASHDTDEPKKDAYINVVHTYPEAATLYCDLECGHDGCVALRRLDAV